MKHVEYKVHLEDVKFSKDKENNCHLSLKYRVENPDGSVDLITFPSVCLPILRHAFDTSLEWITETLNTVTIDCGFGSLPVEKGQVKTQKNGLVKDVYYVRETIKDAPPKEMTLDEIEKQLGYKVKIINHKGDENDSI